MTGLSCFSHHPIQLPQGICVIDFARARFMAAATCAAFKDDAAAIIIGARPTYDYVDDRASSICDACSQAQKSQASLALTETRRVSTPSEPSIPSQSIHEGAEAWYSGATFGSKRPKDMIQRAKRS
ncbi:unnamed protein product [Peniophora sp. CBMAI 1063]|nr:unnamed protein product [Peniophora sp. CBMAI 1063]